MQTELNHKVYSLIKKDFWPQFGKIKDKFPKSELWQKFRTLGTELWLDSGNIEECKKLWTQEFTALTTNNTLLNKEIQTGRYDSLIGEAFQLLSEFPKLTDKERMLEIAFILNAYHALRLVEQFDCFVSVEEHTDLSGEIDLAINYAQRYYAICPERFIVKIPFTPAGLLVTRQLSEEGIPVNHTLGFSARQNYVIARIGKPRFVNVFLGRLNSFAIDNNLGNGLFVGEKATVASQNALRKLRSEGKTQARQIGASLRSGQQVMDLAGLDVLTIPPKAASDFLQMKVQTEKIADKSSYDYEPVLDDEVSPSEIRINTLWDINPELIDCVDKLEHEDLDSFTPGDLVEFFQKHGCGDFFVKWTNDEIQKSKKEGKIPKLENWKEALAKKRIGLDSLMNLAGLYSFATDQDAMDGHVRKYMK